MLESVALLGIKGVCVSCPGRAIGLESARCGKMMDEG